MAQTPRSATLFAETALLAGGWARDVRIEIGADGEIVACTPGAAPEGAERAAGPVVPGMPNLHSHAFQRAMVGLAERAAGGTDNFWTWREVMYGLANRVGPDELEAVAAQLYAEMLCAGYTSVAEFHYIHHDRDGRPHGDRVELAERIVAAAALAGIGVTLLPVQYESGGFDGAAPGPAQRRFVNRPDEILGMVAELRRRHGGDENVRIGLAPHSLRAVPPAALAEAVAALRRDDPAAPIHIHIAEQRREVEQCLAARRARPVEWLLANAPVGGGWCLVHATHIDAAETRRLAASGAVAGLCPTTEGNLGDGFFPLPEYLEAGGRWGIGSDSHASVDPREELRWLEYGQRLRLERRNVVDAGQPGSPGRRLWDAASAGGAAACGRAIGALAPGRRADLVVLDATAPALYGRDGDALLDAFVFAGLANPVRDVMVGGRWVVRDGRHAAEEKTAAAFRAAMDRLTADA